MSSDARKWKMDKLRSLGVVVVEHRADYSAAVAKGRKEAEQDPKCHFVDDENSTNLFLGYAVGGLRLKAQLENLNVEVNEKYPLCVHLPCGVGGAPGGITFGLKLAFGDNVHCYFAEPVDAPCMTLGLATGLHDKISIQDIGLTTTTEADGLAVGRPSGFVGKTLQHTISGCYTVSDEDMFRYITMLNKYDNLRVEPSAAAGFAGPTFVDTPEATHIIWATGGAMVPKDEMSAYLLKGAELIKS
jgi:D-serine dehydratase